METSKCEVLIGLGIIIDIYNNLYHFLLNTFLRAIFKYIEKISELRYLSKYQKEL